MYTDFVHIEMKKGFDKRILLEILERMGIGNTKKKILTQTCHCISVQGELYIVHYKEFFGIASGKESINWKDGDIERRNKICNLLEEWGIIDIKNPQDIYYSYGKDVSTDDINVFILKRYLKNEYEIIKLYNVDNLLKQGLVD